MKTKNLKSLSQIRMDATPNGQHLDLFLIGYVGDWGNSIEDFLYRIRSMPNLNTIDVYISSLGGCFEDGLPIFNLLKMHPAYVTTKVIGYACSMASVIMLAGDKVQASQNAIIMIHRAQGFSFGDADEMLEMANILAVHEKSVIPEYMKRMKKSEAEILALLKAETWFNATPALEAGLIDEIIDSIAISDGAIVPLPEADDSEGQAITENAAKYALEHYKNIPTALRTELEKVTGTKQQQTLFNKLLNFIGKEKSAMLTDNPTIQNLPDEIEMTKDELKAELAANNEIVLAKVAELTNPPERIESKTLDTQVAKLKAQNESLAAKVENLESSIAAINETLAVAMTEDDTINIDLSAGAVADKEQW